MDDDVPDYFTSSTLDAGDAGSAGGILGAAVAAIVDASPTDCLEPGLFQVLRSSDHAALPLAVREQSYIIRISSGAFFEVCSGSAVACANLPRLGRVVAGGLGDAGADAGDAERAVRESCSYSDEFRLLEL